VSVDLGPSYFRIFAQFLKHASSFGVSAFNRGQYSSRCLNPRKSAALFAFRQLRPARSRRISCYRGLVSELFRTTYSLFRKGTPQMLTPVTAFGDCWSLNQNLPTSDVSCRLWAPSPGSNPVASSRTALRSFDVTRVSILPTRPGSSLSASGEGNKLVRPKTPSIVSRTF